MWSQSALIIFNPLLLFNRIDQRRQPLDADLQTIARFDRPDSAGRSGENDIAGHQSHVGGDKTDELKAIENQLAGV